MAVPVGLEGAGLGVGALDGPVAGRGSGVALDHGCAAASSGSEGAKNGRGTALRLPVTKSWLMGSSLETTLSAPQSAFSMSAMIQGPLPAPPWFRPPLAEPK